MSANNLIYKVKTANLNDVHIHLMLCNYEFIPRLDSRVNIEEYSIKIHESAITFEAWNNQKLIGLIAVYFNKEQFFGYITSVSVCKEFMGKGIATILLEMCINYATTNKCKAIRLEVNKKNIYAVNFYKKYNFTEIETNKDSLMMSLSLKNKKR